MEAAVVVVETTKDQGINCMTEELIALDELVTGTGTRRDRDASACVPSLHPSTELCSAGQPLPTPQGPQVTPGGPDPETSTQRITPGVASISGEELFLFKEPGFIPESALQAPKCYWNHICLGFPRPVIAYSPLNPPLEASPWRAGSCSLCFSQDLVSLALCHSLENQFPALCRAIVKPH